MLCYCDAETLTLRVRVRVTAICRGELFAFSTPFRFQAPCVRGFRWLGEDGGRKIREKKKREEKRDGEDDWLVAGWLATRVR